MATPDIVPRADGEGNLGTTGVGGKRWININISGDLSDGTNSVSPAEATTAYTHSQTTSGNPHSLDSTDVGADPAGTSAAGIASHEGLYDHTVIRDANKLLGVDIAAGAPSNGQAYAFNSTSGDFELTSFNGLTTVTTDTTITGDGTGGSPLSVVDGGHDHTLADVTDSGTAAALNVPALGDAASGEVVKGDDTRLTDARTPSTHATSHEAGGGDVLSTLGNITISDTAPTVSIKDTSCTDSDVNASIVVSATSTGSGAEDIDVTFNQQVAGALTAFLTADADGLITIDTARYVNVGSLLVDANVTDPTTGAGMAFRYDGSGRIRAYDWDAAGYINLKIDSDKLFINSNNATTGTTRLYGGTWLVGATPTLEFVDSDTADQDTGASISANATDTGSGTEDVDVTFNQQIAGALTPFLTANADGAITFGSGRNVVVNGQIYSQDTNVSDSNPSIKLYDTDCASGDISAQIDAQATDTGAGTEDIDVTLKQQINGTLTAWLTSDADGDITFGSGRAVQVSSLVGSGSVQGGSLISTGTVDANSVTFNEIAEPSTPAANDGILYVNSSDNNLHYKNDAGEDRVVGTVPSWKSTSFASGTSGSYYSFGFYDAPATDANLTQASATVNYGAANHPSAAHAFLVAAAAGTASGGTGAVEIEVSGTSIDDTGTRTAADTEVIVADITTMSTNAYYETSKKWIGQVTYTLQNAAGSTQTTFAADFNYGFCKYEDFGNRAFNLTDFEVVGKAGATDTSFDIELLHHNDTGWTYSAAAFVPGNTPLLQMTTDHSTESDLTNGDYFAYKRAMMSTAIAGASSEGLVARITTGVPNSVENSDLHIGIEY